MYTHPIECPINPPKRKWTYRNRISLASDPIYAEKARSPREGLEFGMYMTMKDEEGIINTPSLAFIADTFEAMDEHIPGTHQKSRTTRYVVRSRASEFRAYH